MSNDVERVAFYLPSFERGGVERFLINITDELAERKITVDVLTYQVNETTATQLPDSARVVRIGSFAPLDWVARRAFPGHVANAVTSFPGLVSYLRRTDPDLFVSMQTSPFAVVGAWIARSDATVVIRESNTPSAATAESAHRTGKFAPYAKRFAYPRSDKVVAVSADAAADVATWLDLPDDQVTHVYNPTYSPEIVERSKEPVDHPWFEDDDPVLVSVGRLSDQKDFKTLIEAIGGLKTVRLVIVGDGANREQLERFADDKGLKERVEFVGYQSNPYKYMARADLFVLSSHYEGLPNVVIEALSCGTAVVATDCPSGPREILLDGEGGTLVPVGDVEAMRAAISESLTDADTTHAKLQQARAALDRFTPKRAAEGYLSLSVDG